MDYDVGIVGYGPVGATLAVLLAKQGVSVGAFERDAAPSPYPRAGHFDGEVMRILQAAGVADELAPTLRVGTGMKFVAADGRLLLNWPRPQEIGAQGWHSSYRFYQPGLEALLRAEFARLRAKYEGDATPVDPGVLRTVMVPAGTRSAGPRTPRRSETGQLALGLG